MPTKKTASDRAYEVDAKRFTWHPESEDGEDQLADVKIPLRIKLGTILDLTDVDLDASGMATMLERLIPNQMDTLREMDVNDFTEMFTAWQAEYNLLTGATLPEASGSAS